jgi:hypothetical protein
VLSAASPVLSPLNDWNVIEGAVVSFQASATDADGDRLVYGLGPGAPREAFIHPDTGDFIWRPGDEIAGPIDITVTVTDTSSSALTDSASFRVRVGGLAPLAGISAPDQVAAGQQTRYTLWAYDGPADIAAGIVYDIDWDGDGQFDQQVTGGESVKVTHTYNNTGTYQIGVVGTDKDGLRSSLATHTIDVSGFTLEDDPNNSTIKNLVFGGTEGTDFYVLVGDSTSLQIATFMANGTVVLRSQTFEGVNGRVIGHLLGGNDLVLALTTDLTIELHGGEGNDVLIGGEGTDFLFGEGGDDILSGRGGTDYLVGGEGHDLIFGGDGADWLIGSAGEDLILAGKTSYEMNSSALISMRAEWTSQRNYDARVMNLSGTGTGENLNGNYFLTPGLTIQNDQSSDYIIGGSDRDMFLHDFLVDNVVDWTWGEQEINTPDFDGWGPNQGLIDLPDSDDWLRSLTNTHDALDSYVDFYVDDVLITDYFVRADSGSQADVTAARDRYLRSLRALDNADLDVVLGTYHSGTNASASEYLLQLPRRALPLEWFGPDDYVEVLSDNRVVLNYADAEVRDTMVRGIVHDAVATGQPVLFLDNIVHHDAGHPIDWDATALFLTDLTDALHERGIRVIVNIGWNMGTATMEDVQQLIGTGIDGISLESWYQKHLVGDQEQFLNSLAAYRAMLEGGMVVQLLGIEDGTLAQREAEQDFLAAVTLMVREPGDAAFVVSFFWLDPPQWASWSQELGDPLGEMHVANESLYYREFTNGVLVLNAENGRVYFS